MPGVGSFRINNLCGRRRSCPGHGRRGNGQLTRAPAACVRLSVADPPQGGRPMTMTVQEREALVAQYARGPQRIQEALARVPSEALKWRPDADKWSVHEVVVHC